ncbi:MAG: hypothetical protein KFB96_08615 [Thiocapsa sp.]|jgi:hypothetical protein|uniref:hypothetical protein n=1 Tax=Thiocapsa sp. TaxID=2024551 RepID=UPI001BCCA3ED|nr:hypothetical protein [Thiocapsa sp.]QVL50470.1 MAG: hypothetical protein KFB96_08615 [Thiocapsa sp.]
MTPFLLLSGLLLGLASATASQGAGAAESWGQARQPTWGDAPVYSGGYPDATSTPEPWVAPDDRAVYGGWRESSPGPSPWGEGAGSASPQPEYRFRGDPQPWSGRWSGQEETPEYRFRPLTGREAEQRAQTPGWRPLEPGRDDRGGRTRAPAGLMDALTPPPRTFGFEPTPRP